MKMKKVAMFVFNGDPMCFIHVLLNALDMEKNGDEVKIVIEGASTKLVPELAKEENPLHALWEKAKEKGLVEGVCRACSNKTKTLDDARMQSLNILDDMSGHPGMAGYREKGYDIITF
jgi:hypothetical protein